jgi:2-oxoisovalerate dehydrogenase E1 component
MHQSSLNYNFDFQKIEIQREDYAAIDRNRLAVMLFELFLIRQFEEMLLKLSADGCVNGPVHTSIGEEACAAGAMAALLPEDQIASTHRAHHHYLAKAISATLSRDFDILKQPIPDAVQNEVIVLMSEVMGLAKGCCGGRGGSMHLRNPQIGVLGTNAIVAGGVPGATGAAFAARYVRSGRRILCFLGDGAVNQGAFHEAANLAGLWHLPIVYFIENNLYAVATPIRNATAIDDLVLKATPYGLKGLVVDGMDPVAVFHAVNQALKNASQDRPTLIEARCYRFPHHAGPTPGSGYGYRGKEEEHQWQQRDPLTTFPKMLNDLNIISPDQVEQIRQQAAKVVETARQNLTVTMNGKMQVPNNLWPAAETLTRGLRSSGDEFNGIKFAERQDFSEFETMTYVGAIAAVTGRHLETDSRVFVLGEEIANFGGGPYQATKGLPARFPDRVLNTPISESGFSGLAGGAAMSGLRPIVEIMFPDFALVAADQLFNQIGKLRHMYGNTTDMPLVARTRIAIGCGYGGQHSLDPVGLFSLFSGWHVVAPSTAFDYIGLFNSAMRCTDPVLMMEHHCLYAQPCEVPKNNLDYFIQLGRARVVQPGQQATVLCYSSTVGLVCRAAEPLIAEGITPEIIDLRTISPPDIDYETIAQSLRKTHILVIVEQAPAGMALGPRLAGECQKRFFDELDGPVVTLAAADVPLPVSRRLEAAAVPQVDDVRAAILDAVRRRL